MTKIYYLFLCLTVCCFFSSCDEDEKEAIPPVVTIGAPDASTKLLKTVNISASATDDSGISSIKILVDETLLHETGDSEISYDWNTETVSDGEHTITVIATDAVGNEGSESLTVEVFNDKNAPQVTLTSPSAQPFVKSTIKIEGSVADESTLESIKIYVGDVLLTTLTNTNSFSFDWDTKAVPDGNYSIRVSATDSHGNEASATAQVKVFNYFITLNVVNPLVPSHVKIWYLISKYDGTLIQAKPYVEGENKIRFETPDNYNADERYLFSTFQHLGKFEGYLPRTEFFAETGFAPGERTISPRHLYSTSSSSDVQGFHTVKIDNVPAYENLFMKGVNMWSPSVTDNALSIKIGFYDNNNNLNPLVAVLRGADEAPRFKNLTGLQIGGTTQTNFNEFTPMVGNKILAHSSATYTYDYVFGVTDSKYNESDIVWTFSGFSQPTKAHYLYAPAGYAEYIYGAQEGTNFENNYYVHVDAQAPATFLRTNAAITSYSKQQRTLSWQTSGVYDFASLSGSVSKGAFEDLVIQFWSLQFTDGTSHTLTLPELPSALAVYDFPSLSTIEFGTANFFDYSGFNGYQEMRNFLKTNPQASLYSVSKDFVSKNIAMTNPGGRAKNDTFSQTVKLTMEFYKRLGFSPF